MWQEQQHSAKILNRTLELKPSSEYTTDYTSAYTTEYTTDYISRIISRIIPLSILRSISWSIPQSKSWTMLHVLIAQPNNFSSKIERERKLKSVTQISMPNFNENVCGRVCNQSALVSSSLNHRTPIYEFMLKPSRTHARAILFIWYIV